MKRLGLKFIGNKYEYSPAQSAAWELFDDVLEIHLDESTHDPRYYPKECIQNHPWRYVELWWKRPEIWIPATGQYLPRSERFCTIKWGARYCNDVYCQPNMYQPRFEKGNTDYIHILNWIESNGLYPELEFDDRAINEKDYTDKLKFQLTALETYSFKKMAVYCGGVTALPNLKKYHPKLYRRIGEL